MFKNSVKIFSTALFTSAMVFSLMVTPEMVSAAEIELGGRIRAGYGVTFNNVYDRDSLSGKDGYLTKPGKTGFMLDDARIKAEGTAGKFDFEFEFELEAGEDVAEAHDAGDAGIELSSTTAINMKDMKIGYNPFGALNFTLGQFKIPYSRQRMVSSGKQLQNGRAEQIKEFVPGRELGFMIDYQINMFKVYGGWFNGNGDNSFDELSEYNNLGMFVGRVEVYPFGKMKKQEGGMTVNNFQMMIGASALYNEQSYFDFGEKLSKFKTAGSQTMVGGDITLRYLGAFLSFEAHYAKFSANSASDDDPGDSSKNFDNYTIAVGAGYYIPLGKYGIEPTFRFATSPLDIDNTEETQTSLGYGVNFYIDGNDLKLQVDFKHNLGNDDLEANKAPGEDKGWDDNELNIVLQLAF